VLRKETAWGARVGRAVTLDEGTAEDFEGTSLAGGSFDVGSLSFSIARKEKKKRLKGVGEHLDFRVENCSSGDASSSQLQRRALHTDNDDKQQQQQQQQQQQEQSSSSSS
jgi:hypothetical protein